MTDATTGHFFEFRQNNSGGSFYINDGRGIGPRVWIEAEDANHANEIAERLGIYFDGVNDGMDCGCCGDRWYPADGDGVPEPAIDQQYSFNWHGVVYVHHLDGTIARIRKSA